MEGTIIDLRKIEEELKRIEKHDQDNEETELKCIYCQLFINKYLRAK